jgi:serine protease Do
VKDGDDLVNRVSQSAIGSSAAIGVDRNGKKMDFQVTIGDREEQLAASEDPRYRRPDKDDEGTSTSAAQQQAKFGISIRPTNETERQKSGIDAGGVVVTQVQENSFADEIGLQERDIVVAINRQPVSSFDDVKTIQQKLKSGDAVAFRVLRPNPFAGRTPNNAAPQYQGQYIAGTLPNE